MRYILVLAGLADIATISIIYGVFGLYHEMQNFNENPYGFADVTVDLAIVAVVRFLALITYEFFKFKDSFRIQSPLDYITIALSVGSIGYSIAKLVVFQSHHIRFVLILYKI